MKGTSVVVQEGVVMELEVDNKNNITIEINKETNLAKLRRVVGYTQVMLADKSGISLRTIQQYENRARDINKASAITIWSLARALQCRSDQLLELEIDMVTECIVKRESGESFETAGQVVVRTITTAEAKLDKKAGWKFDWKKIQDAGYEILELFTPSDNVLQGRISYKKDAGFYYVDHVETAPHNYGHNGEYMGVAANMFAIICLKSRQAGFEGFVSFVSKKDDKLMNNYREKLGAIQIGNSQTMYINDIAANALIEKYGLEAGHE